MADQAIAAGLEDANENPYVKAVNKRHRLVKKKLQKIEALENKPTDQLNAEQQALLQNKPTLKLLNDELNQILSAFETVDQVEAEEKKANKNPPPISTPPEEPKADIESEPAGNASTADTEKQGETETDNASVEKSEEQLDSGAVSAVDQASVTELVQKDFSAELEEKLEQTQKLFRAVAEISQQFFAFKLKITLQQTNTQINEEQLQELRMLGHLCLEMPTWAGNMTTLCQDKSGMDHLMKLLSESDEKPNVWHVHLQRLAPLSQTYAELSEVLKVVSHAIKTDGWLQSQVLPEGTQSPAPGPSYPQQAPEYAGGYGTAPSNPFTAGAGASMMPEQFHGSMGAVGMNMPEMMGSQDPAQGAMGPPPEMNMAANYHMGSYGMMNEVPVANMYMANQGMPMAPTWNPFQGAGQYPGGDRSMHKARINRSGGNGNGPNGMNGADSGNGRQVGQQRQQRRRNPGGPNKGGFGGQGNGNMNGGNGVDSGRTPKNNRPQQPPQAQPMQHQQQPPQSQPQQQQQPHINNPTPPQQQQQPQPPPQQPQPAQSE